jgi:hypothetical protein
MKNDDKLLKRAVDMAKSSIYDGAKYVGQYNGCAVYEPTFKDNKRAYIGFTQFIIAKNGVLNWVADEKTSRAVLRAVYPDDE